jgi:hypothetical protein
MTGYVTILLTSNSPFAHVNFASPLLNTGAYYVLPSSSVRNILDEMTERPT